MCKSNGIYIYVVYTWTSYTIGITSDWSLIYIYITNTVQLILLTIVYKIFPGCKGTVSSQDIQCTKNVLYGGIHVDMSDGCLVQKTSFEVTTTKAPEQTSYYEN